MRKGVVEEKSQAVPGLGATTSMTEGSTEGGQKKLPWKVLVVVS